MNDIKTELKNVVTDLMIPEVESYLNDLHKLLENNVASEDDINIIKEMESFLVELENILLVIKENKISDEEANKIHQNILKIIEDSK